MAQLQTVFPEVDSSLGLLDSSGSRLVVDAGEPLAHCGPVVVPGRHGEMLRLCALGDDLFRVSMEPAGETSLTRTWTTGNGQPELDARTGGGWDRSDMNRFAMPLPAVELSTAEAAPAQQQQQQQQQQRFKLSTGALEVRFGGCAGGEQQPFRLEWAVAGQEQPFASDSVLGAYAYEKGGKATHRMERSSKSEWYYGLGEVSGPLNRAGRRFRLECRDAMGYDAERGDPLYKHFPFYVTYNAELGVAYGILYDQLCSGVVDLGQEISAFRGSFRTYETVGGVVDYFVILGPSIPEVIEKAGRIVGRPAVPPGWALGYVASTMTYADAPDAQARLEAFPALCDTHDMPCDGFYLSSGYTMDADGNRNVFTWNRDRVPRPEAMLEAFHARDMSVIANVKPWLLTAHPEYEAVGRMGCYFRDPEHPEKAVQGWFWKGGPGTFARGSYLDFTNPVAATWWKEQLKKNVLAQGVDAVWNDNNEYELDDSAARCALDEPIGKVGRALQSVLMARASYEALLEAFPDRRPLVVSRSGALGISRYAAQTWSGDNTTSFHTMRWNIPMSLGLGLCGWVGNGADIGGFAGAAVTPELFVRWIQLGIYFPRFSIHSASWKPSVGKEEDEAPAEYNLDCTNEPWMFPEHTATVRELLRLRCRLRPLLLSLHLEAFLNSFPVMRPLVFHHAADRNPATRDESFEFLLGQDLLVAAVLDGGEDHRAAYLPGDDGVTVERWCDLHTGEWHAGGSSPSVIAPLEGRAFGAPIFLRSGAGLVLGGLEDAPLDAGLREVILGRDPSAGDGPIEVTWFEDPSEAQRGHIRSAQDMVTVDIDAVVTDGVVTVSSVNVIGDHAAPFHTLVLRLVPHDTRTLTIAEGAHLPDQMTVRTAATA